MSDLEEIARKAYMPLIRINNEELIFNVWDNDYPPVDKSAMLKQVPETVIDKQTLSVIQVEDLHKALDYTITTIGSATLFRSLIQPPTSLDLILAKQDSVRELKSNNKLRNAIEEYLGEFRKGEKLLSKPLDDFRTGENALLKFLNGKFFFHQGIYGEFSSAMKTGENIPRAAQNIPTPKSNYAKFLINEIKNFRNSPIYNLMRGPIYRVYKGWKLQDLKSKENVGFFTTAWKFTPTIFGQESIIPFFIILPIIWSKSAGLGIGSSLFMDFIYGMGPKIGYDIESVIGPMHRKSVNDEHFISAIDSIGKLDELISFIEYAKAMPHDTTLPTITNKDVHYFRAENLRNPIQAKEDPDYVPNPVNLDKKILTFITGPNSGGKTTYCKSIFQNQLLGQIGCYVVASDATMNIADRMAYQRLKRDKLQDEGGEFEMNLMKTRDIFYTTNPKSLVILDFFIGETTPEEKMKRCNEILNRFYKKGNNTILITLDHKLVSNFKEQGKGQYLQVEFKRGNPTYRLIEGISKKGHSEIVAKKIGFSKEDMDKHLIKEGYIQNKAR